MITKYKLKKDLPDVKAGTIVQLFGSITEELYKSMVGEGQHIPEIGWYWKDDKVRSKYDVVNFNKYCRCQYTVDNLSEWLILCILTTNDGVDKYEGDTVWVYYVNSDSISWLILIGKIELEENVMFFSTKEAAEKYVKSIKPKFKKGAILKNGDKSFILDEFDIEKHKNCEVLGQYPTKHDVAFDYDKTPSISKVFNRLLSIRNEMIREYNKAHKCNWEADFRMIIDKKYNTQEKWTVSRHNGCLCVTFGNFSFNHFPFPTEELAEYSLKEHEELWKIYYQL
jgi:hypothetical protein